jgi:choline dehydrogenase-like flavoprotein
MENHVLGADDVRGAGGPLGVSFGTRPYPLADAMLEAASELGIPVRDDINRPDQEGIAYLCTTIKGGRRQSSAEAFLRPAARRQNLRVVTNTLAHRVLFDGKRAVGIAAARGDTAVQFRARREVILSAGALQWALPSICAPSASRFSLIARMSAATCVSTGCCSFSIG